MLTINAADSHSDEQLVKMAQSGDSNAMEIIILRYRNMVNAVASKYYDIQPTSPELGYPGQILVLILAVG